MKFEDIEVEINTSKCVNYSSSNSFHQSEKQQHQHFKGLKYFTNSNLFQFLHITNCIAFKKRTLMFILVKLQQYFPLKINIFRKPIINILNKQQSNFMRIMIQGKNTGIVQYPFAKSFAPHSHVNVQLLQNTVHVIAIGVLAQPGREVDHLPEAALHQFTRNYTCKYGLENNKLTLKNN